MEEQKEIQWENRDKSASYLEEARDQTKATTFLLNRVKKVLLSEVKNELKAVSIGKVIEESIASIQMHFPNKKIGVEVHITEEMKRCSILADDLLSDVFVNILSNSVKAMDTQEKKIIINIEKLENSPGFARISIIDFGKGMPEEMRPKSSGRFFTQSTGGFGMGLSIVMRVVENYGGYVWYENRVEAKSSEGTIANIALRIAEDNQD